MLDKVRPRRGEKRLNKDTYIESRLAQDSETAYLKRKKERQLRRKFYETQYPNALQNLHDQFNKMEGN